MEMPALDGPVRRWAAAILPALVLCVLSLGSAVPSAYAARAPRGARLALALAPALSQTETLTGSGTEGELGFSVALSADGSTALVGAPREHGSGAAWIFTRSGSTWVQGPELKAEEQEGEPGETLCAAEEAGEETGECGFGRSVALSANGETALVGAPFENGRQGGAWVFTRLGSNWTPQGEKLTEKLTAGSEVGAGHFGRSVALSTNGDIVLVGAPGESSDKGAAWAFTRTGSTWSEGEKLTSAGEGEEGAGHFGRAVTLSASGETALIGAPGVNEYTGAAWIFTRQGEGWSPLEKLVGGEKGHEEARGHFGYSVALSGDGDTALVGARGDHESPGAAWAFTRSGFFWTQPGEKLTGAGGDFGSSVALSGDGDAAVVGSPGEDSHLGGAWTFTRSGATWTTQGTALMDSGELGNGWFGASVALSADGMSALVGGPRDNVKAGKVWAFQGSTSVPPPTVTSVTPSSGPSGGATKVKIEGTGFLSGAKVEIGAEAGSVKVLSETEITAKTAAAAPGEYEVLVIDSKGVSTGGPRYTYVAPAGTTSGAGNGGTSVTTAHSGLLASKVTLPPPVLGLTGNLAPISGKVLVKLPGSSRFVPLTGIRQVPFGTIVDATHGRVQVTTITPSGHLQTIVFFAGKFKLTQQRNGLVVATLFGGNFSVCPTKRERSHLASVSSSHASGKHVVRKLWAEGHGKYETKGNYASGAVQGTRWLTEDLCEGTLIRVATDRVLVTNLVNHRHFSVKARHKYLAKAP
jgi:hypothetical protein